VAPWGAPSLYRAPVLAVLAASLALAAAPAAPAGACVAYGALFPQSMVSP
jgi:hypothetical protein